MPAADFDKFIKLMMLTQSPNDAEALSALRKANAYMASVNMNWEEFLRRRGPTEKAKVKRKPGARGDEEIEEMIAHLEATVKGSFAEFVASIREWWDEHQKLSERQYEAIRNAYDRSKR